MPSTKSLIKQSERHAKVGMQHPQVGNLLSPEASFSLGMLTVIAVPVALGGYLLYRIASRKKSK